MNRPAPSVEDQAFDAAKFAQIAQVLGDDLLGNRPLKQGDCMLLPEWQADLLIFAIHKAKFAADDLHQAVAEAHHPDLGRPA